MLQVALIHFFATCNTQLALISIMSENESSSQGNSLNLPLVVGGFVLLGVAFVLILFGGTIFGGGDTAVAPTNAPDGTVLEQVPQFETAESSGSSLPSGFGSVQVGDTAVNFTLQDTDGNSVALSDFEGQPIILNFWATWCAPCRIEMPELQETFVQHQDEGLVILAVDQEETAVVVEEFFNEFDLTFTPLLDTEGQIAQAYGVVNFPSTFFIDRNGTITALHRGPMVKSQIEGYLVDTDPSLFSDG